MVNPQEINRFHAQGIRLESGAVRRGEGALRSKPVRDRPRPCPYTRLDVAQLVANMDALCGI